MMGPKIKRADKLSKVIAKLRSGGKRVVFTNGCFDVLHLGHIRYLKKARAMGDLLIVGVNSDSSVRSIKGCGRPLNSEAARAEVLASLYFVDYVTIFGEKTPERLIKRLKPDILVKGGDWRTRDIVGGEFVTSYGGSVKSIPYIKGHSTTSLIKKMAK